MRAFLRITLGIVLVIVGIIGWILPVVPGFPFLIPGLIILGEYFPPVRRLLDWAKKKYDEHKARRNPRPGPDPTPEG